MSTLTLDDLEDDQQNLIERTDIQTLADSCKELQAFENEIAELEEKIKHKKEQADKNTSELIPNRHSLPCFTLQLWDSALRTAEEVEVDSSLRSTNCRAGSLSCAGLVTW